MTHSSAQSEVAQTSLSYATPIARSGSPTAAASVIAFIGLGMIVLGGCFLIPLAMPLMDAKAAGFISPTTIPIMLVLYALAFTCFGVAAWLLFIAVRRLISVMRR